MLPAFLNMRAREVLLRYQPPTLTHLQKAAHRRVLCLALTPYALAAACLGLGACLHWMSLPAWGSVLGGSLLFACLLALLSFGMTYGKLSIGGPDFARLCKEQVDRCVQLSDQQRMDVVMAGQSDPAIGFYLAQLRQEGRLWDTALAAMCRRHLQAQPAYQTQ